MVSGHQGDDPKLKALGVKLGTEMSKALIAGGAPGVHFYCLNLEKITNGILKNLGMLTDESAAVMLESE